MTYILCAFEAEARPLIDKYRLKKTQSSPYPLFQEKDLTLIISGMGQEKAGLAAEYLLRSQSIHSKDSFINLGICASKEQYEIGSLLQIESLENERETYTLKSLDGTVPRVSCFSAKEPLNTPCETDIAEMEAIEVYKRVRTRFEADRISFLKIVSDHFKPFKPKKQFIIGLIQGNIQAITEHINRLKGEENVH